MSFIGEFRHSIDDKRRVHLPKRFEEALSRDLDGTPTLMAMAGYEACIYLFSAEGFSRFVSEQQVRDFHDDSARQRARLLFSRSAPLSLDGNRRFVVPEPLFVHAGLHESREAVLLGLVDRIELWSSSQWDRLNAAANPEFAALSAVLDGDSSNPSHAANGLVLYLDDETKKLRVTQSIADEPSLVQQGVIGPGPIVVIPHLTLRQAGFVDVAVIAEFEHLLNTNAQEASFQDLFERHPELLCGGEFAQALPSFGLRTSTGDVRTPDFVLTPVVQRRPWQVVDLKRSTFPLTTGPAGRMRPHHLIQRAAAQVREYCKLLQDRDVRSQVEAKCGQFMYGVEPVVVVGRSPSPQDYAVLVETLSTLGGTKVWTYDDLLERARRRAL